MFLIILQNNTFNLSLYLFLVKPSPSFFNELSLFMNSHDQSYQGDGRTIEEIGIELGLSPTSIHQVQQDAEKADKVAMNIWRKLCPTREDRIFLGSIKNVPRSTLENIYGKSISFINILNKISH